MDTLFIGTRYDAGTMAYEDGSEFENPITVVLYNRISKTKLEKPFQEGETEIEVTFSAEDTSTLLPGVYDMEIYETIDDEPNMIAYMRDYVKAVKVSVSESTNSQNE